MVVDRPAIKPFGLRANRDYAVAANRCAAYDRTMRAFGRLLQIAGLVLLPLAMVLQLTDSLGRALHVSEMLIMLLFGVAAFYAGRIVEGYASR
jgi:hypothetical protein